MPACVMESNREYSSTKEKQCDLPRRITVQKLLHVSQHLVAVRPRAGGVCFWVWRTGPDVRRAASLSCLKDLRQRLST
jgi:hypothetical protein